MILDKVNPNDLYPTEKLGPSVLGTIEYEVQGQRDFEGAYIATNERLIMNVDMNGQFYYRSFPYAEIKGLSYEDGVLYITFEIGKIPMRDIQTEDVETFVQFVQENLN